jgi:NAD(P)H-hydrate epimerase
MARLIGATTDAVEADRFAAVAHAVSLSRAVVLLKGARTLIGAPDEQTVANPSGTPALATAGSGDVLAGITAALCASLPGAFQAACAAAYVHGAAGERWVLEHGADRGLLAHEIADAVPEVLAALARERTVLPV